MAQNKAAGIRGGRGTKVPNALGPISRMAVKVNGKKGTAGAVQNCRRDRIKVETVPVGQAESYNERSNGMLRKRGGR